MIDWVGADRPHRSRPGVVLCCVEECRTETIITCARSFRSTVVVVVVEHTFLGGKGGRFSVAISEQHHGRPGMPRGFGRPFSVSFSFSIALRYAPIAFSVSCCLTTTWPRGLCVTFLLTPCLVSATWLPVFFYSYSLQFYRNFVHATLRACCLKF